MDGRRRVAWALAGMLVGSGGAAPAEVRMFPGSAPCDTTLTACIESAAPHDVVRIATDGPIDETIVLDESLTLEAADGFTPAFSASRSIFVTLGDPAKTVIVRGLTLLDGTIDVTTSGATSHAITVTGNHVTQTGTTGSRGIDLNVTSPAAVVVERNELVSDGYPVVLQTYAGSGAITASLSSNRIRKAQVGDSAVGIELDLRGSFTITADVRSNVVSDVADCSCGSPAGIYIGLLDTPSVTVNLVNNTIDLLPAVGIRVPSPAVGQLLVVNLYNNLVTRALNALVLPAANPRLTVNNGSNDFFDNAGGPTFGGYLADPSNLAVDPLYVNLVARDYHLQAGSPLRDAGVNASPGGLSELDADGNVRVAGPLVDIGAYEFGSSPPTTTSTTVTPVSTTTTTLPGGCASEATTASVLCRLNGLETAIQAGVPAGPLAAKLARLVARARTAVTTADGATKPKARKRGLAAAIRATGGIAKRLKSKKAKDVDASTRTTLIAAADAIRADLKTLRSQ